MLIEILSAMVGGVGLAVFGMRQVQTGLQQMAGRRLRTLLRRATDSAWRTSLTGVAVGAVTQSTNAAGYIVLSLVSTGYLPKDRAFIVASWSALGTAAIVLLAAIRIELAVLYLVGIAGILQVTRFRDSPRWGPSISTAFGVGLLFLGLQLLRRAFGPIGEASWFPELIAFTEGAPVVLLAVGIVLALFAQSSSTVAAAVVALAGTQWFGLPALLALVYGACLGASLSSVLVGWRLSGIGRQILLFQAIARFACVAAVLAIGHVETALGDAETSIERLVGQLATHPGTQAGLAFTVVQLLCAIVGTVLQHPLAALCDRLWPADAADALSAPRFIYEQALEDPTTALDLAEREQERLVAALPSLLDRIRAETALAASGEPALVRGAQALANAIDRFVTELLSRHPDAHEIERAIRLKSRNDIAVAQIQTLASLSDTVARLGPEPRLAVLIDGMIEALHLLLTTAAETAAEPDPVGIEMLRSLSGDRGEIVERMRQQTIREHRDLPSGAQDDLFLVTGMFERSVWLVGRFAGLVEEPEGAPA